MELVPGAEWVDDDDVEVGLEERQVVVAAVPDDHVALFLGPLEDRLVVDARVDDDPRARRAARTPHAPRSWGRRRRCRRASRSAGRACASRSPYGIGCRTSDDALPGVEQDPARRGGWSGSCRCLCERRIRRRPACRRPASCGRPEQAEVRAGCKHTGGPVHHLVVRQVGVREHDFVDPFCPRSAVRAPPRARSGSHCG